MVLDLDVVQRSLFAFAPVHDTSSATGTVEHGRNAVDHGLRVAYSQVDSMKHLTAAVIDAKHRMAFAMFTSSVNRVLSP